MVLSIETTLPHPRRGFIKIEDTVAVTETGWEAFGDGGRGWNRGGTGGLGRLDSRGSDADPREARSATGSTCEDEDVVCSSLVLIAA